jgi:hypothetical protein
MRARPLVACALIVTALSAASASCKKSRFSAHRRHASAHGTRNQLAPRARGASAVINDSNGDGIADLVVSGAPLGAQLLLGSRAPGAALSTVGWRWSVRTSDPARVRAGAMVFAGDLDGDRKSEVAIAQSSVSDDDPCAPGGVRVYYGSASTGLSPEPAWWLENPPPMGEGTDHYALVGQHLARVDEIEGPRSFGLVVSARRTRVVLRDEPAPDGGGVRVRRSEFCQGDELWVYRGATRSPSQRLFIEAGEVRRVVTGRVDRDAFTDLVVLAPPRVLVYRGRAGGFEERPAIALDDPHDDPQRWSDVAVGDVDGDGDGEIVLTFQYSSASEGVARAGIVHYNVLSEQRSEGILSAPSANNAEGAAGRSVLVVRDQDGDHRDEIVIADPVLRAVLVYRGRADDGWPTPDRVLRVAESAGALGVTLVDAGDIDGDQRDEIIVRATRDDGGMATLYACEPLRTELERVALPPGAEGFAYSLAGRSNAMGGGAPRALPPLPRRCEVPSAQSEALRLVTIDAPMVRVDASRVSAALSQRTQALASCQERQLLEDCNRSAVASITLARDAAGALIAQGIAWQSDSTDALRDCVQTALGGVLLSPSREGSDGLVTIHFHEGL